MWFKFPEGVTEISVQQQNFYPEIVDPKDGKQCFRAPAHFSGLILGLKGFSRTEPPEGAPDDLLPMVDPGRDATINELRHKVFELETQLSNAKADLAEMTLERDELKLKAELPDADDEDDDAPLMKAVRK